MKILITGGAGFIASHIQDEYIRLGHKVFVLDNLSSGQKKFINQKSEFFKGDIFDARVTARIISKVKPDIINHHAAQISVRESINDPQFDAKVNILGFLNLLESAVKNKVRKIIFASSGGVVYGDAKIIPTPEEYQPKNPLSPYGVSKLASEYYLDIFNKTYGLKYTALRYSNVYGPRQNPHGEAGVVAIFAKKIIKGEPCIINGNGKQTRDYVYVKDVVRANVLSLNSGDNTAFNIGTGLETNVREIFGIIREALGRKTQRQNGPAKKGEQERSCLNIKKAGKELNWRNGYNLKKGIPETVTYFLNEK